jgi:hypothetical protein
MQSQLLRRWREEDLSLRPALGKSERPYLKNKLKQKVLEAWLKW